jgi:2-keto-4-pentenoate hydratase/2-oxohepta-3-ene-1,7-dioic acid hydratase in catechol pathway
VRFLSYLRGGRRGVGLALPDGSLRGLAEGTPGYPGALESLVDSGEAALREAGRVLAQAPGLDAAALAWLPPLPRPRKILCIGLNYLEHAKEGGRDAPPEHPTVFVRFGTTLVGHRSPLVRPRASEKFDYEGELVAVIGRGGRHIARERALDHVLGYSIFNDGSLRDYQRRTTQWTLGKNFDHTGGFGPWLVTADELPAGARGLRLRTRLNGEVLQDASTDDMIFDIPALIAAISEVATLEPGDLLVTGTPAGVGFARKPPLWMKAGDTCEVEIEGIGTLVNPVIDEAG